MKKYIAITLALVSPAAAFIGAGILGKRKAMPALMSGLLWFLLAGSNVLALEPPVCQIILRQVILYRVASGVESASKPEFSKMGFLDLRDSKRDLSIRNYVLADSKSRDSSGSYGFIFLYKRCYGMKDRDTLSISGDCRTGLYQGKRVEIPVKFMKASLASMRPEFRKEIAKDVNCKIISETEASK
jgi:hypothetical protein